MSGCSSYSSSWNEDDEAQLLQMADQYRVNGKPDFKTISEQMKRRKGSVTRKYNKLMKELPMDQIETHTNGNKVSLDPMQKKAVGQMNQYKMDSKTYWNNLKPFWNGVLSMAKSGEREDIKATLKDDCGFSESKSGLMAQWFIDNFKQTETTIHEAPKGMQK